MQTKTERIAELLDIISNKSGRIKKLKLECGQRATKICVLNLRIEALEKGIGKTCDLIRNKGKVSKWKILNWLEHFLKGE